MSHLVANKPFVDPPHDKLPSSTINHTTVIEATELITRQLPNLYPPEAEELRRVTMGEINRNKLN